MEPLSEPQESFLQQKRTTKEILIMIVVVFFFLFLLITFVVPRIRTNLVGKPLTWTYATQSLLPLGKTVALQSITSGKFLQIVPKEQALPNCDQVSTNNYFLEASGTDKTDAAVQWIVEGPSQSQKQEYGNHSIQLKNLKSNNYITELVNPVDDFPAFTWSPQASPSPEGSPVGSALFATSSEKKNLNEVMIIGADIANNEYGKAGDTVINEDSPFFLTGDRKGRILAPSKVPLNRESVWLVHFLS